MKDLNKGIIRVKCIQNDDSKLSMTNEEKLQVWKSHCQSLLNKEYEGNEDQLPEQLFFQVPPIFSQKGMVAKDVSKMKPGRAAGSSCITVEMIKAPDNQIIPVINLLTSQIIIDRKISEEWTKPFQRYRGCPRKR